MSSLVLKNRVIRISILIFCTVIIFLAYFTNVILNEQAILAEYQTIFSSLPNFELSVDSLNEYEGSYASTSGKVVMTVGTANTAAYGLELQENQCVITNNYVETTITYTEISANYVHDIYNNYLLYLYSSYLTWPVILTTIFTTLISAIFLSSILFFAGYTYDQIRFNYGKSYRTARKWTIYKLSLLPLLVASVTLSYSIWFGLGTNILAVGIGLMTFWFILSRYEKKI